MLSYWLTAEQFHTPLYSNTLKHDWLFHILKFLHLSDNMKQPDGENNNYDRLWKIRTHWDQLNDAYAKILQYIWTFSCG